MKEISKVINQCVKCGGKFTSIERPLKLLPCLHSMCLDCLHGRIPIPPVEKKIDSSSEEGNSASLSEKSAAGTDNGECDSVTCSKESTASDAAPSGDTQLDDSKEDVEKIVPDTNGSVDAGSKESNENPESSKEQSSEPQAKSPEGSEKDKVEEKAPEPEKDSEKKSDDTEEQDVKPTPAKECPLCRDPIHQSSVPLMDNMFAALDTSQVLSPGNNTSPTCTGCEEGQPASTYCEQCEEWLCDSCVDAHKRVKITKDHTMSPKDQVKNATLKSPWDQQIMCKQHKQEHMKFFCEKCEALTCRDCQLVDHKDHKYQFLDQAAEQYKARLKGSLALMGEKKAKLSLNQDEIKQKLANCKEQKDNLQQEILEQADILVKGIKQAVWNVLSNLASFTDAATKRLNKEIEDVSDLIGKFDHCVHFMENILNDGSSMSLLYSKGSVEAKCRKVYHTPVDPQSLKGNLLIQYKHEVNWLLGNVAKIGSIYVNGVRYPPDKNGGQGSRHSQNSFYQEPRSGLGATSPHLQHMANQAVPGQQRIPGDWNKLIQTGSKPPNAPVAPPNMTMSGMGSGNSLPPQLTLPSYRRQNSGMTQSGQGMPNSGFPGHFSGGQGMPQIPVPHMSQGSRPGYTSMRLHHRPAHPTSFSSQNDRMQNSQNNMRSPPLYRMGGEASGSFRPNHGTPDPARPASAGMYDGSGRPDSGGGDVAIADIKKERRDQSPDCVITSTSLRSEKQSHFQTSPMNNRVSETILEMQKNLDDVIRSVPMDLSDNLEQISGFKPLSEEMASKRRPSPPSLSGNVPVLEVLERTKSPTDQELRDNWQGGNSMPGFSLPPAVPGDPNDDYCACCHNGGDVLCCDKCPRVFHLQCHIPEMPTVPSGSFVCTICEGDKPVDKEEPGKSKSGGISETEVKVCERILLELFCHPSSVPFQDPVNKEQVPNYYKIITQPMDFNQIKSKLEHKHPTHYQTVKAFLFDIRQVFINCAIYNKIGSEVGKAGRMVRENLESLVSRLIPQYLDFVKENPTPCFSAIQQMSDPYLADDHNQSNKRDSGQMESSISEDASHKRLKTDNGLAS